MAISVNYTTKVITVPQADLTNLGGGLYQLDLNTFRLALKDWEDEAGGMSMPDTHVHVAPINVGSFTLARVVQIVNGYTVTFEDGQYAVNLVGANTNLQEVVNVNQVSVRSNNSAGLVQVVGGGTTATEMWQFPIESGLTAEQMLRILMAVAAGKTDITDLGGGLATVKFRDRADTKDRVTANMTGSERTSVTVDGT